MRVLALVLAGASLLLTTACGGDSDSKDNSEDNAQKEAGVADAGMDAQVGDGGLTRPNSRIDPSAIPQAFTAYDKAKCGELGESCSFLAGSNCEGSICDLLVEVCMPTLATGSTALSFCEPGSCDQSAPYCISGRCLTLEQASCVCGAAGGSKLAACGAPAISALGGKKDSTGNVCLSSGARCGGSYTCCNGQACTASADGKSYCEAQCVADGKSCAENSCCGGANSRCLRVGGATEALCYQRCTEHSQCPSKCCSNQTDPQGGFCVESAKCTTTTTDGGMSMCVADGATCDQTKGCCNGLSCVTAGTAQSGTCRPSCTKAGDCTSGCCKMFASGNGGYCADALQCTCIPQGQTCGMGGRSCCDGSRCASFGDAQPSCHKTCQTKEDCGGNCCVPLTGGANICSVDAC